MNIIKAEEVTFEYVRRDENGNIEGKNRAIDKISLDVKEGDFISILGANGSGKSTFAKHLNSILLPTEGTVWIDGMDSKDDEKLFTIRQTAGMVSQNPDNQIIGQVVEEDVAFGPENMGIPTEQIRERVDEALKTLGMMEFAKKSPNRLSGGQKQRVSIAGVLAMHPKCIVLDEPTAMLDPAGRKEVIRALRALNEVEKITIILITHYMEETIYSDKIFVMNKGKIMMEGSPREIFTHVEELEEYKLEVPKITLLAHELKKKGVDIPECVLSDKELADALKKISLNLLGKRNANYRRPPYICLRWKQKFNNNGGR